MRSRLVQAAAHEAGLAWRTVERAKHRLGVEAGRIGGVAADGQWCWRLPPPKTASPSAKTDTDVDVAVLAPDPVISVDKPDALAKTAISADVAVLDRLEVHLWPRP